MVKNFINYFEKNKTSVLLEQYGEMDDIKPGDLVVLKTTEGLSDAQIKYLTSRPFFVVKDVVGTGGSKKIDVGYNRVNFPINIFNKIDETSTVMSEEYPIPQETVDPLTGEVKQIDFKNLPKIKEFTLFISDRLLNILKSFNSPLAKSLIANNGKLMSNHTFIDFEKDTDPKNPMISCIASNKLAYLSFKEGVNLNDIEFLKSPDNPLWVSPSRGEIRIGSLVSDLFSDFFGPNHIEEFTNEYKSYLAGKTFIDNFKIITGEDIKKYYQREYYSDNSGTLAGSCMTGKDPSALDLYCENPDKIGLLCLFDPNRKNKILGRAILWKGLRKPKDRWFLDRIYTTKDDYVNIFKQFAIQNNWLYKKDQVFYVVDEYMDGYLKIQNAGLSIVLKPKNYNKYPYLDTMKFYTTETGRLGSTPGNDVGFTVYILQNPNGGKDTYEFRRSWKDYIRRPG